MIKSLYIKDFALIDELDVQFEHGLNIMTGQTGAGKSIIIGALNMILGERADTEVFARVRRRRSLRRQFMSGKMSTWQSYWMKMR